MTLTLIRGLPGAGKDTYAAEMLDARCVTADSFFVVKTPCGRPPYDYSAKLLRYAHTYCQGQVARLLFLRNKVCVANTFSQAWEMALYRDMAFDFGVKLNIVELYTQFESTHNVPQRIIDQMRERWEAVPSHWEVEITKVTENWRK